MSSSNNGLFCFTGQLIKAVQSGFNHSPRLVNLSGQLFWTAVGSSSVVVLSIRESDVRETCRVWSGLRTQGGPCRTGGQACSGTVLCAEAVIILTRGRHTSPLGGAHTSQQHKPAAKGCQSAALLLSSKDHRALCWLFVE